MMNKIFATAAAMVVMAGAAFADPVEGNWRSAPNDEGQAITIAIAPCGSAICGTIRQVHGGDNSLRGKALIWDMKPQGGGKYGGGKVWAPDDNKTYNAKMQLNGNTLKISGCVGPFCRGTNFSRQ